MNLQEAFNAIYIHAQKKERAHDPKTRGCRYRTSDGKKCFVGCLIPDEVYNCGMEGGVPTTNEDRFSEPSKLVSRTLKDIGIDASLFDTHLVYLQRIHDKYDPPYWNELLKEFAERNSLTIPDVPATV